MSEETRNLLLIALATSTVATPLLVGAIRKQIPKEVLLRWAAPLMGATFLMVVGIRLMDQHLDPTWKLVGSLLFGFVWCVSGVLVIFRKPHRFRALDPTVRAQKILGLMLLVFGILWLAASVFRFG